MRGNRAVLEDERELVAVRDTVASSRKISRRSTPRTIT
jgi:hypothetical protein